MRRGTFSNPVHGGDFADPFVLKHGGTYWAFATGYADDGGCFPMMRSTDLVTWEPAGSAMAPLTGRPPCMWAPEAWYEEGRFFLYYSAGDEEHMELRVAVAGWPGGPYVDAGVRLTREEFAIDAHVFRDRDGKKYLFYATDFLEHTHVGTGVVVDRMRDPFTLAGSPVPVVRARYEWQIYDPRRESKGGVCWHTVEGPFVLERDGRYVVTFSGGNWQNESYGVSYATADRLLGEGEWRQHCDGAFTKPILTTAGGVRGPGHNSIVRGPDNQQLYCVYHFWPDDLRGRVMAIDRLEWAGDRLEILGPTVGPQPAPNEARVVTRVASTGRPGLEAWEAVVGSWRETKGGVAQERVDAEAAAVLRCGTSAFVFEVTLRPMAPAAEEWSVAVALLGGETPAATLRLTPGGATVEGLALSEAVDFGWPPSSLWSGRLVRVVSVGRDVRFEVEGIGRWRGVAIVEPDAIALSTGSCAVAYEAPSLTVGWEERFDDGLDAVANRGWRKGLGHSLDAGVGGLALSGDEREPALLRETGCDAYELVAAVRLSEDDASRVVLFPAVQGDALGPELSIGRGRDVWEVQFGGATVAAFTLHEDHAVVRVRKQGVGGEIAVGARTVATVDLPARATHIGIGGQGRVHYTLVRVTELWPRSKDSEER